MSAYPLFPTWPQVRCASCGLLYRFEHGVCPDCGIERFYTQMDVPVGFEVTTVSFGTPSDAVGHDRRGVRDAHEMARRTEVTRRLAVEADREAGVPDNLRLARVRLVGRGEAHREPGAP